MNKKVKLKLNLELREETLDVVARKAKLLDYSIEEYIKYLFNKDNEYAIEENDMYLSDEDLIEFEKEALKELKEE